MSPGPQTWTQACNIFPDVLQNWQLNKTYNFQVNTIYHDFPFAHVGRPILPRQFSLIPGAGKYDYAGSECPLYIEVELDPVAHRWEIDAEQNGMEILDDGTMIIPSLRDFYNGTHAWRANPPLVGGFPSVVDDKLDITLLHVRTNVSLPFDHRVTFSVKDSNDTFDANEIYSDNPDAARISSDFVRRDYRDLQQLYQMKLRRISYPRPESQKYPRAEDGTLRDDTELMKAHMLRAMWECCRLEKGGELRFDGYLVSSFALGTPLEKIAFSGVSPREYPLHAVVSGVHYSCTPQGVSTGLILA